MQSVCDRSSDQRTALKTGLDDLAGKIIKAKNYVVKSEQSVVEGDATTAVKAKTNGTVEDIHEVTKTILADAEIIVLALTNISNDCTANIEQEDNLSKDLEGKVNTLIEDSNERLNSLKKLEESIKYFVARINTATSTTENKDETALNPELLAVLKSFMGLRQSHREFITTLLGKIKKAAGLVKGSQQIESTDSTQAGGQTQGQAIAGAGGQTESTGQATESTPQAKIEEVTGDNTQTNSTDKAEFSKPTTSEDKAEASNQPKSEDDEKTVNSELDALLESHDKFITALLKDICKANHTTPPVSGTQDAVKKELAKILGDWKDLDDLYETWKKPLVTADAVFIASGTGLLEGMPKILSKLAADLKAQKTLVSDRDLRIRVLNQQLKDLEPKQGDKPNPTARPPWKTRLTHRDDGKSAADKFGFGDEIEIWELNRGHLKLTEWRQTQHDVTDENTHVYLPNHPKMPGGRPRRKYSVSSQVIPQGSSKAVNSIEAIAEWFWVTVEEIGSDILMPSGKKEKILSGRTLHDGEVTIPAAVNDDPWV